MVQPSVIGNTVDQLNSGSIRYDVVNKQSFYGTARDWGTGWWRHQEDVTNFQIRLGDGSAGTFGNNGKFIGGRILARVVY